MKALNYPISRITLFFIVGILLAYYFQPSVYYTIICIAITLPLALFFLIKDNKKIKQNIFFGITIYVLFLLIGMMSVIIHNESLNKNHYLQNEKNFNKNYNLEILILEKLKNTKSNYRFVGELTQIDHKKTSGKIIVNFRKTSEATILKMDVGHKIKINELLLKNFKPSTPNQFDYGKYLESKNIYGQIFTEISKVKVSMLIKKDIWYYASHFRNNIINNLSKSGFKKGELAVVVALILGQQQDISPDVMRDYQYAGAVHILSVSGLHVGFVLLLVGFLLKPLPKNKFGNITKLILILLSLWLFAIVAGLAPSVVRSATMFSFIAIGEYLNRETNRYHNLLASIFIILLFEPLFLFDIGFQLSYIAVFFILWLEPMLKQLWKPKYKTTQYFWSILTVSFAAQIGTLPLSLYYFHQFPGLFFVTNLALIPCLTLIMFLGVLLMILAAFDYVPHLLSKIVEFSITLMNDFINWIASMESFILKEIPLSFSLLLLLYLVLFSIIIWFKKPNYTKLAFALASIILFQILYFGTNWSNQVKSELIVFNVSKKTIITQRKGTSITVFTNDSIPENSFENKMILSYATANFCETKPVEKLTNTYLFNGNKILVVDEKSIYKTTIKPDIIVLRQSPKLNLDRLIAAIHPKLIIADGSNYKSNIRIWKLSCVKAKIPFHSTYEKGYYCLK